MLNKNSFIQGNKLPMHTFVCMCILHCNSIPQPVVNTDTMIREHSQLTAAVLDFESCMVNKFILQEHVTTLRCCVDWRVCGRVEC